MSGKYRLLTTELQAAAARGQRTVDMSFDEVDALVGRLPPSAAGSRQWWANSSHVQALAWQAAGFNVAAVSLDHRSVRFAQHDTSTSDGQQERQRGRPATSSASSGATWVPVDEHVDVRVLVSWTDGGRVVLDQAGKPAFGPLPGVPGLYRLTSTGGPGQVRPRVYIGESDNLRRRLASNYRSPGSRQRTSLRINAALRGHLAGGGRVDLVLATEASAVIAVTGSEPHRSALDLTGKAARLLAENAALVTTQVAGAADIENLS